MIDCGHCGEAVRIRPSEVGRARYCSLGCYRASGAETGIEQRVRVALERLCVAARPQVKIGRWVVDFLVGDLVIEADGTYWHAKRPDADQRKTAGLQARGFHVWRLSEEQINAADFPLIIERQIAEHEAQYGALPYSTA